MNANFLQCFVFLLSGIDRWIVVSPDGTPTTPRIGDNILIVCEVAEDSPYNNPKWLGPNVEEVQPLGSIGVDRIGVRDITPTSTTLGINGLQHQMLELTHV